MNALKGLTGVEVAVLGVEIRAIAVKESDVETKVKTVLKRNGIKALTPDERRRSKVLWLLVHVLIMYSANVYYMNLNPTMKRKPGSDIEPFGRPLWQGTYGRRHINSTKAVLDGVEAYTQQLCDLHRKVNEPR